MGIAIFKGKDKKSKYDTAIAERTSVVQEVSATGIAKPAEQTDLAFEKSGTVYKTYVKVGDKIKHGQLLVALKSGDLQAQLAQADASIESAIATLQKYEAALRAEQSKFDEIKSGKRSEEIKIAETKKRNARKSADDAKTNLDNAEQKAEVDLKNIYDGVPEIVNSAYNKADNAARITLSPLFSGSGTSEYQLTFSSCGPPDDRIFNTTKSRLETELTLNAWHNELNALAYDSPPEEMERALQKAITNLQVIKNFLNKTNIAISAACYLDETLKNTYRGYVNTSQTDINTALANVNAKIQAIAAQKKTNRTAIDTAKAGLTNAQSALLTAESELELAKAGSREEEIKTQEAQVQQAEANLDYQKAQIKYAEANRWNIWAQMAKTVIRSPIDGVVTKQETRAGEIVSSNEIVVSVMSEAKLEIETFVPEVDVTKLSLEDEASVTLDAYDEGEIFKARVVGIDPAETIIDGVSTYKIKLQFEQEDERIKSGMTANIEVLADKRENAISIPQRAVISKNGDKIVRVLGGGEVKEVKVETGLKGSNGTIEIISGVNEGDTVIVFIEE